MLIIDYIIIAVVLISAIVGLVRGFFREAISVATWLIAITVVYIYAGSAAEILSSKVESPVVRLLVAGAALFIAVLLLGALVSYLVSLLVQSTGLSGTDRVFGMVFGGVRGFILLALLLVLAVGLLPIEQESWWSDSRLIPYVERVVVLLHDILPPELGDYLKYDPESGNLPTELPAEPPATDPAIDPTT